MYLLSTKVASRGILAALVQPLPRPRAGAGDAAKGLGGLPPSVIIRAAWQIYADLLRPTRFPEVTILSQMATAQLPSANSGETKPR